MIEKIPVIVVETPHVIDKNDKFLSVKLLVKQNIANGIVPKYKIELKSDPKYLDWVIFNDKRIAEENKYLKKLSK